jgi:hypothetical protein
MMAMGTYWVLLAVPEWVDEQLHGRLRDGERRAWRTGHCRHCNLHAVLLWLHGDRQRLLALGLLLAQGFEPAIQEVR